ncbi:MAG: hypothetical protein HQK55_19015 [Deltaproteobacteria bacterium]|nr:hypothetical protein [Deltaproteobacteria bacterium]
MKRTAMIILIGLLGLIWNAADMQAARPQGVQDEFTQNQNNVTSLLADISTINLLNALNLTKDQMNKLLALAEKAKGAREQTTVQSEPFQKALKEAEEAFQALRTEIQKGSPAKGEIPQRAVKIEQQLKELRDQAHRQLTKDYKQIEAELNTLLTPEQIKVINDFSPCLIPPVNLRDPVRAGQAASNEGAIKSMRRIREIPEANWPTQRTNIAQRIVEQYKRHKFRLTEEEQKNEQERVIGILDKIRKLSGVDFEMQKENLATELQPVDRMAELRQEMESRTPREKQPRFSKAGRFLLEERIISILKERLGREGS